MASKKLSTRANSYISVLTLLVILAVVGLVSQLWLHSRLDLTEGKQFTLNKASIRTLESLKDQLTIKAVISKDLPTQFSQIRTHVVDLLQEFQARSDGKVRVIFEDPGESEEKRSQATSLGIQEVQLQEQSREGLEIKKGFFGLAITYGDKKEVIPVLQNLESFEYDLVVKIKKVSGSAKTIGIIEGTEGNKFAFTIPGPQPRPTTGFDENFNTLREELEKAYKLEKLDPLFSEVRPEIDMLLVAAPQRLTEIEKFRIDQFLMQGKSVLFLSPGVDINLTMGINGTPTMNGYEDLLAHYGLGVRKDVILEAQNFQFVRFGTSFFPSPYPYWIILGGDGLSRNSPITSKLGVISMPWASSIEVDTSTTKGGAQTEVLAWSSKDSWQESGNFFLMPRDLKEYRPIGQKAYALAALKSGTLTSFYASHPVPADSIHAIDTAQVLKTSKQPARILVVGNALFATDFYVGYTNSVPNFHFMLNSFDQLALDPDLINIRSRELASSPILEEKKAKKIPILLINLLAAPLILLGAGIFLVIRRRKMEAMA